MSKRSNGKGSVFQRASDGAWIAQASLRTDDGRRRYISRSARTREEAERLLLDLPLPPVPTAAERFARYVPQGPGCWEWAGSRAHGGYGQFLMEGRLLRTHRVSWELTNGPIPEGMQVCHKCDNPPCVRPDHLFLGTASDNMRDMIAKGRNRSGKRAA